MAKAATKNKASKAAKPKKAPARAASKTAVRKSAKAAPKKAPAAKAPPISKDALRTQLEQLTAANATLKTKNREANKALKAAASRIAELEHQISQSESKPVIEPEPAPKAKAPRKPRTPKLAAAPMHVEESQDETATPADGETI